jgi:hypothetical protein
LLSPLLHIFVFVFIFTASVDTPLRQLSFRRLFFFFFFIDALDITLSHFTPPSVMLVRAQAQIACRVRERTRVKVRRARAAQPPAMRRYAMPKAPLTLHAYLRLAISLMISPLTLMPPPPIFLDCWPLLHAAAAAIDDFRQRAATTPAFIRSARR